MFANYIGFLWVVTVLATQEGRVDFLFEGHEERDVHELIGLSMIGEQNEITKASEDLHASVTFSTAPYAMPYDKENPSHQIYFDQRTLSEKKIIESFTSHMPRVERFQNGQRPFRLLKIGDLVTMPSGFVQRFESTQDTIVICYVWLVEKYDKTTYFFHSAFYKPYSAEIDVVMSGMWSNIIIDLLIYSATDGVPDTKYRETVINSFHKYYLPPQNLKNFPISAVVDKSRLKNTCDETMWKSVPRLILDLIAKNTISNVFVNKGIFVEISEDLENCTSELKSLKGNFCPFVDCLSNKPWTKWVAEQVYKMVEKFAYNHSIVDKKSSLQRISPANVISIVDAMVVTTFNGLNMGQDESKTPKLQEICVRISAIQRRLLPNSIARASFNRQSEVCKTKTDGKEIFKLVHNRAILLNVLTRIHNSFSRPKPKLLSAGAVTITHDEGSDEYFRQTNGWIRYFVSG